MTSMHQLNAEFGGRNLPVALIPEVTLVSGGGDRGSHICAMELVSWIAGEPHSYAPECASIFIANYVVALNDGSAQSVRDDLRSRAQTIVGTSDPNREEAQYNAAFRAIVANLSEALTHVKDPDEREIVAPIVEQLNARLSSATAIKPAYDLSDFYVRYRETRGMSDFTVMIQEIAQEYLSLSAIDRGSTAAHVMRRIDSAFGTSVRAAFLSSDPQKPRPGARSMQALDQIIAAK